MSWAGLLEVFDAKVLSLLKRSGQISGTRYKGPRRASVMSAS